MHFACDSVHSQLSLLLLGENTHCILTTSVRAAGPDGVGENLQHWEWNECHSVLSSSVIQACALDLVMMTPLKRTGKITALCFHMKKMNFCLDVELVQNYYSKYNNYYKVMKTEIFAWCLFPPRPSKQWNNKDKHWAECLSVENTLYHLLLCSFILQKSEIQTEPTSDKMNHDLILIIIREINDLMLRWTSTKLIYHCMLSHYLSHSSLFNFYLFLACFGS